MVTNSTLVPGRACARRDAIDKPDTAAGAAETKHRYAGDVGSKAHYASHTGFKTWRCDSGGADGHDGVDIAASEVGACQRLLGDVDEQRLGTFEKRLGAFRPASRLEIPVERFHGMTFDNSGIRKNARVSFEFGRRSRSESHVAARTSFCKNMWGGTDVARETSAAVGIARSLLPLQLWETSTRAVYSSAREDHRVESDTKNVKHAVCAALGYLVSSAHNVIISIEAICRRWRRRSRAAQGQREGDWAIAQGNVRPDD